MAKHAKAAAQSPFEGVLGLLAAAVWFVTQGAAWLRLLVAGVALGLAVWLVPGALAPTRAPASTVGPVVGVPVVLAPARLPSAAVGVAHV